MPESSRIDEARTGERQAQLTPGAIAATNLATSAVMQVDRPAAGQMKVVEISSAKHLKFSFDLADCKISVLDVDAILIFADGGKLVLPGFAMQMIMAEPPVLQFSAGIVEPQVLLARAGDVTLIDQLPQFALSENARGEAKTEIAPVQAQVVQVTASQTFANTPGPKPRPFADEGTGNGDALIETTSRYAKKIIFDESQSSGTKAQGSITDTSKKVPIADAPQPNAPTPERPLEPGGSPPTLTSPGSFVLNENGRLAAALTATDADPSSTVTYSISGGRDADRFAVNSSSGLLYFIDNPDFEANSSRAGDTNYELEIQASNGRASSRQQIAISLSNVNEMPDGLTITSSIVSENTAAGSVVGSATGRDPDAGSQLTYSFAPGGDAGGRFAIDGQTGVVSVVRGDLIDFEASQSQLIVVRVTDQGGLHLDTPIVVAVTDANDAPIISSNAGGAFAAVTVFENVRAVTTVTASDADAGSVVRYSISGGVDASQFSINTITGELNFIAGIDFEVPSDANLDNIYNITVQASDGLGGIDQQNLAIAVVNANDPPDTMLLTANVVQENAANGTVIGRFEGTDPDTFSVLRYSFLTGGDAGGRFGIDAMTGELTVLDGSRLNFEDRSNHTILVRVTDQGGLSLDGAFVINLTDVNEAPAIISDGGGATASFGVVEGTVQATRVTAADPEGAPLAYSIIGGHDAARLTINAASGVVSFVALPDFETPGDANGDNVYEIMVQVSDGTFIDTQTLSITVQDIGEPPVITSNGGGPIALINVIEGASAVTVITATDPDAAPLLTYSIIGGVDFARFTINSLTGALSFIAPSDFENPLDAGANNTYDIVVQVSDGVLTDTQAIMVSVQNVNDAPIIVSDGGGPTAIVAAAENSSAVTTVMATDIDAGSTLIYTIAGGADASRFTINSSTGVLTFIATPDFEAPADNGGDNVYDLVVQVLDGVGGVDTQSLAVTVTNQNEAPAITSNGGGATAAVTLQENLTAVASVAANDPDMAASLTFSITGGADAVRFTIDAVTGALSFIAPPDFDIAGDAGGNNVYDVVVQVSDGLGGSDTQAIAVTLTNQNEAPVITSNGGGAAAAVSVQENQSIVTSVAALDPDAATTLTYTIVGGADQARFVINPTTGALSFVAVPDFEATVDAGADNTYDVTVQVSDGTGGIDTQSLAVTVTNQNEAPAITSNGGGAATSVSIAENGTGVLTVTAADPDAAASLTYSIAGGADAARFSIDALTGALSFIAPPDFDIAGDAGGNNVYDVIVQVSDGLGGSDTQAIAVTLTNQNEAPVIMSDGGGTTAAVNSAESASYVTTVSAFDPDAATTLTYTIVGGADQARFVINTATGALSFVTVPDFEAPSDSGGDNVYDVVVQVSDGLGGVDTQSLAVTVTNQNEAPVITSNGGGAATSVSIAENGTGVLTVTAADPDAAASLTYSIAGGADAALFTIDALTGALSFIAPPDFDIAGDAGGNNVYDVVVQVSDGLGGSDTQAIAVTLTNQNEAPVITSNGGGAAAAVSVQENTPGVTIFTAADPDAATVFTYSIVGGADQARFAINAATGALTFAPGVDFEAPSDSGGDNVYDVVVQVSDGLGGVDTQSLAVTVTNQNEAPVITSNGGGAATSVSIAENGTGVLTVTAADPDAAASLTYSIAGGADAALFTIDAVTGVLSLVSGLDFELPSDAGGDNTYDVIVQVSDGLGGVDAQAVSVSIANVNEAPVITSDGGGAAAAVSLAENAVVVTTVAALDPDAGATRAFSIAGGADAGRFAIDSATGVLSFISAPNFEAPADSGFDNIYDVVVQVSDGLGGIDSQTLSVTVVNANEAPAITSNGGGASASVSISENGTALTTVAAADPDAATTLSYAISGGADAALFTIDAATGVLTFIAGPDFETPLDAGADNVYDVIVQASDGSGGVDTQAIAVTVTNQNEAPAITSSGGGAMASLTHQENGLAAATVAAADADAGAVLTYAIVGGLDAGRFSVDSATGALTFIAAPDFEAPSDSGFDNVYDVIVQVSDGLGGIDSQAIAVTVINANEAPVITSGGGGPASSVSIQENSASVMTVLAADPDAGAMQTYSISGGADAALFTIDTATGALSFVSAPDREAPADAGADNVYDVTVQVSDGLGGVDAQAIAVTVTDQNDTSPDIVSNGGGATASVSVTENAGPVTTVAANDPDLTGSLSYAITGGADQASFTINASTGALTFIAPPDFEAPSDGGGDNVYDLVVSAFDGVNTTFQSIAVTVTNQNEAPVITSDGAGPAAALAIAENGTAVTTVTASDVDAGPTLSYSIIAGADAALFAIDSVTGALRFLAAPDFESPLDAGADNIYDLVVQVSDGLGGADAQAIAITVGNQNEAPAITSNGGLAAALVSVAENQIAVATVAASDPDSGAVLTYAIVPGGDAARFAINSTTGVLTFIAPPDFEAPTDGGLDNVYDVVVQVSDGLGGIDNQTLSVTVVNANEAPAITSGGGGPTSSMSIQENNAAVAAVAAADPDSGASLTYSISGGVDAALFSINTATGALTFIAAPDFEAPSDMGGDNVYDVIVAVSDGALTDTQAVAVTVTDANDVAPAITSNGGAATALVSIAENGAAVTTFAAADPDTVGTVAYAISGGADAALFSINAATGVLTFLAAPDFENPADAGADNIYDVTVRAFDGVQSDDQAVAVTVTDANDVAPAITSNGGAATALVSIAENGAAVTTVAAADPDTVGTVTYAISGGADAALFSINAATGVLTFLAAPDFENPSDAGADNIYDVVVQASDGTFTDAQAIAVTVTDANDVAPAITSNGGAATASIGITENGVTVTTVTAADPDMVGTVTYAISGGSDAALFSINGATGALTFVAAPDFEAPADTGADNIYDVTVTASDGINDDSQAIAVTVTDDFTVSNGTMSDDVVDFSASGENQSYGALDGADAVVGSAFADTIAGGAGNDTITGSGGADVISGGDGDDAFNLDGSSILFPAAQVDGGIGSDSVFLQGAATLAAADLTATFSSVETIDFTAAGVSADLTNFTAASATAILGASGPGNTLTLDLDGDDSYSVQAGEFFSQSLNVTTFYSEAALTNEIARVAVI